MPRHVAQIELIGQELALWRDDAGHVNAWENRCPHRGVRLSIGINDGQRLRCRYHSWQFESGSGQCAFIPAQPDLTPPKAISAKPYPVVEAYGLVWASLGSPAIPPELPMSGQMISVRSIYMGVPAARLVERLAGDGAARFVASPVSVAIAEGGHLLLLPQPSGESSCILHGLIGADLGDRLTLLRRYNAQMVELRDELESGDGA